MNRVATTVFLLAGTGSFTAPAVTAQELQLEEVVVTGSRVIKNGDNSPTPVTVLAVEDMQTIQPSTISDNLNNLPVFSGSRNQTGNPNPQGGNGAANQLNLRNLGAQRNLILFDGHRVPPTLTDGTVDVDMIPQMLIQKVDMVTGGVSAVYGSDAISGVVNFIVDRNFNGIKANAQYGISEYKDGEAYSAGVAFGSDVGSRGHFIGSYEYRDDKGVLYRSSRPWNNQWAATGLGTAQRPYYLVPNVRLGNTAFGGLITNNVRTVNGQQQQVPGALTNRYFSANGVLSPFNIGTATGSDAVRIGGDGAFYDDSLKAPLESHQIFGRFDYDLTDDLHAYVMASANLKKNIQYLSALQLQNITFRRDNAFLSPTYRAELQLANETTFRMSEFMEKNAPRRAPETQADQYFMNAGLEGKLGNYDWDVSYVRGMTRQETIQRNNVHNGRLFAALDAVQVTSTNVGTTGLTVGSIVCNVALTNPGLYPGCVPLNIFGPTSASAEAIAYIHDDTSNIARQTTDDVTASISGETFSTWAGPITSALSAEWRRLTYGTKSEAISTDRLNCTGLLSPNCTATTTLWQNSATPRDQVSQEVKEVAYEFDAPLLKDVPAVQSLNINGAVRYTSYSTSGSYTTWKAGLDWHINSDFRFRGTASRDIRAPTLDELFAPQTVGRQTSTDLLTGATPTVDIYGGGNPNLVAEIGKTKTVGVVWRPSFLPNFSMALDGYHILIDNALSSVMGTVTTAQNACYASGGTSPYCALQTRPLGFSRTPANQDPNTNAVTSWRTTNINISQAETYGLDLEMNYTGTLMDRRFAVRGFVNWQPHLIFDTPGLPVLDHGGVAYSTGARYPAPQVKVSIMANYQITDRLSLALMERWRSALTMKNAPDHVWVNPRVASVAYTSMNLAYELFDEKGRAQVFLNVQNLFDKDPPPAAFYSAQTQPGQFGGFAVGDDPIGRYYTAGVRVKL